MNGSGAPNPPNSPGAPTRPDAPTPSASTASAVQLLDGVANAIFGVAAVLVIADRTRGTGRFNLVQGALATAVGLGAALSTAFGGKLIQLYSCRISFLALGGVAAVSLAVLWLGMPETRSPTGSLNAFCGNVSA